MSIIIKVAKSAQELNDVYRLRHQVYVESEGYFKDMVGHGEQIVDHFDTFPYVANVIAYSEGEPVGTMRMNRDTPMLLPSDEIFDFGEYRDRVNDESQQEFQQSAVIGSAGMLAIAKPWRNRRDVFRSLFKVGCDIGKSWGASHIIATVNVKSATIYKKLGFEVLGDEIWVPSIGESVVPMGCKMDLIYNWAFGALSKNMDLIEKFSGSFQYRLISANSVIFEKGAVGNEAYLIGKGSVKITQPDAANQKELNLTVLKTGDLFGEFSLIDDQPRSASAIATTNTELIVLTRDDFWGKIHQDPSKVNSLLHIFCERIREVDERCSIYAHGSVKQRLSYFINQVQDFSVPAAKEEGTFVAKITKEEFSYMASVTMDEASSFLEDLQRGERIKVTEKEIHFYGEKKI